jgi:hypothetical protein
MPNRNAEIILFIRRIFGGIGENKWFGGFHIELV